MSLFGQTSNRYVNAHHAKLNTYRATSARIGFDRNMVIVVFDVLSSSAALDRYRGNESKNFLKKKMR